jgi:hypothetical protein
MTAGEDLGVTLLTECGWGKETVTARESKVNMVEMIILTRSQWLQQNGERGRPWRECGLPCENAIVSAQKIENF